MSRHRYQYQDTGQGLNISTEEELRNHPALGKSWEEFVLEEIIRREKISHPHSQFFFWRTAAGAEADMVIDRGDVPIALEIKCGAMERIIEARNFSNTQSDIGAEKGIILDQGKGTRSISPQIDCRGFADDVAWLP